MSWQAYAQDLGAKVVADNLNALLCLEALEQRQGQVSEDTPTVLLTDSGRALEINRTRAFAHIRQCLPRWLSAGIQTLDELTRLLSEIAQNVIAFVPLRQRPGPPQHKPHKAFAAKVVM
jgi:hypothetical protein